jgi:hypothetical protein
MSREQKIMWDILTEYSAALSGGPLELAGGMPMRSQTEAQPVSPACAMSSNRSMLGLLWNKVSRP